MILMCMMIANFTLNMLEIVFKIRLGVFVCMEVNETQTTRVTSLVVPFLIQ